MGRSPRGHRLVPVALLALRPHDREAGGVGPRTISSPDTSRSRAARELRGDRYWQVLAHVRWAIIAIQQAERHRSGAEASLELALTAHIVPELEWEILALTGMR
jgi:hypothetical protein